MKKSTLVSLALLSFALGGCTGPVIIGGSAATIYETRPGEKPPADTQAQIPPHQDWCYSTMGDPECFSHPQDTQPNRLINVGPQNRYPLDRAAYARALAADQAPPPADTPTSLAPDASSGGSSASVQPVSQSDLPPATMLAPAPKTPAAIPAQPAKSQ